MTSTAAILWTAVDAAKATGGQTTGDWKATGVSIDTRTLQKGDLFVALKGDALDGHDYVARALAAGAAAAVVSRRPDHISADAPLLIVGDTMSALQDLGKFSRHRAGAKIIAVTGSVGKTGTKEMLAAAFGALGQTHASKASFNNHWGVPFSLSGMNPGTDFGIFEIGMNHAGEITPLTKMVKPDIAIITTIAAVHTEHFASIKEIADAKAEIFDGMDHNGVAILPRDNEFYAHLAAKACLAAANGSRIKARVMGQDIEFTLLIPGRHIALNALAVLLAVKSAGGDIIKASKALAQIPPIVGRGKREFLNIGDPDNPVTLIDETYNASPVAMNAAFKVLALIDPGRGGRRIAILGDMLELGRDGPKMHADLALPLQAADVNLVYTCGTLMKNLHDALPQDRRGQHRANSAELAQIVPDVLTPGDVVMVKGSKSSKMGIVVEALRALPEQFVQKNKQG